MEYDILLKEREKAFVIVNSEGDILRIDLSRRKDFKEVEDFIMGVKV